MKKRKGINECSDMNILVIGNGFDLAHGLPTSYSDFLNFCKSAKKIYTYNSSVSCAAYQRDDLDGWIMNDYIKKRLKNDFENRQCKKALDKGGIAGEVVTPDKALDELYTYIKDNTWLEYFENCPSYVGENWIDFEAEIARVIRSLDDVRDMIINNKSIPSIQNEKGLILTAIIKTAKTTLQTALKDIRAIDNFSNFLYAELERLIRALEIYIAEFVGKIKVEKKSADISALYPDHLLSFNYSNTYERIYGKGKEIEYDYFHGKADVENTLESNNMVLGIDEYLPNDVKDKKTEFIAFKKYYQRMHKKSKRLSEIWCSEIKKEAEYQKYSRNFMMEEQIKFELVGKESGLKYSWQNYEMLTKAYDEQYDVNHPKHNVYIFGHSLDITDKDILRNLILNDNVYTTIFYCKKKDAKGNYDTGRKDYGQKLANLVKVIGQDELIKRTGGSAKTIEFKLQQDML